MHHQDKSTQQEIPAEDITPLGLLKSGIKRLSRALPGKSHDCLRLVDRACRPREEECRCQRCEVERQLLSKNVLGQSWIELEKRCWGLRDLEEYFQQNVKGHVTLTGGRDPETRLMLILS